MTERQPRPTAHTALRVLKGVLLGTLMAVLLISGMRGATASDDTGPASSQRPESLDEAYSRVVERAMSDHRCSYGQAADPGPASALVRIPSGDVQVVSFEHGWDVYNGKRPGSLIAVCLDPAKPTTLKVAPRG